MADLRTARILCVLIVGLRRWARCHRTRRGALAPLELHLCAARNELRTLHKSEQFAAMAWCAGTAYKMRDSYLAWAERFRTHLREPLEDSDSFVVRLALLL